MQKKEKEPEKKERKKSETEVEVDGTKELHVTLSPRTPAGDPPETEELIKALMVSTVCSILDIIKYVYINKPSTPDKIEMQLNPSSISKNNAKFFIPMNDTWKWESIEFWI